MNKFFGENYYHLRQQRLYYRFRYRLRARCLALVIRQYLPHGPGLRVLDFGAADGLTLRELDRYLPGCRLEGVEASFSLLRCAGELPENIRLWEGDITCLPPHLTEATFDVVSAMAVLEHLTEPLRALREARRMLRPGGLFVASVPHPCWERIATAVGMLPRDIHLVRLGRKALSSLIGSAGLQLIEYRPFMWAPVGVLPYAGIPVPLSWALALDRWLSYGGLLGWTFVNQYVVATRR